MPSENDVLEIKKKRFSVLNTMYDLAKQDENEPINTYEIKNKTKIEGEELYHILEFLLKKGLIKEISPLVSMYGMGGNAVISITHKGFCEVEDAIEKPNERTENFPANIFFYTYVDQNSSSIGIGVNLGENKADKIAGTINEAQKPNLEEIMVEIDQLLEQLDKSYPTDTTSQKMRMVAEAIERIERNPSLHQKILRACKAGTIQTSAQSLNHPVESFIIKAFEYWQKNQDN